MARLGGRIPSMALIWWQFRVARGWLPMSVGLAEVLMRASLGFAWGLFRLGKLLICGMLFGELKS